MSFLKQWSWYQFSARQHGPLGRHRQNKRRYTNIYQCLIQPVMIWAGLTSFSWCVSGYVMATLQLVLRVRFHVKAWQEVISPTVIQTRHINHSDVPGRKYSLIFFSLWQSKGLSISAKHKYFFLGETCQKCLILVFFSLWEINLYVPEHVFQLPW